MWVQFFKGDSVEISINIIVHVEMRYFKPKVSMNIHLLASLWSVWH